MAEQVTGKSALVAQLEEIGVVPLVTLASPEEAVPLAQALAQGGAPAAEVTFRSSAALAGMKLIRDQVPDVILVAGTVHSIEDAQAAVEAGCKGIVTPAFNEPVVDWCLEQGVPVVPGTATPTDVERAYDKGLRYLKFFPAGAYGGVKTLKALAGPFAEVKFLPTGGVNLENAKDFLALKNVFAIGGSFPVPSAAQESGDWEAVAEACRKARQIVRSVRGE
ncbi:ketohydroxyglutarate aldolase [Bombiscardovia nodaiensis]|uniref:Ketohydroxyglutarate aldolase n=1 Tax=Bombiscardovia nodaiensis TaxID=2932181 RepID=A0ABM8B613_9BIFI|nr:ketohydroxyglutarate aldolase [Bombiscardovia nodaiensis]